MRALRTARRQACFFLAASRREHTVLPANWSIYTFTNLLYLSSYSSKIPKNWSLFYIRHLATLWAADRSTHPRRTDRFCCLGVGAGARASTHPCRANHLCWQQLQRRSREEQKSERVCDGVVVLSSSSRIPSGSKVISDILSPLSERANIQWEKCGANFALQQSLSCNLALFLAPPHICPPPWLELCQCRKNSDLS